ncbi:MAG: hypothetical protein ACP5GX_11880, partial [Anaerolineae bacterium]
MVRRFSEIRRTLFPILLLLIILVAGWVRSLDINWDEGTHLHPDERYLTMVASALDLPTNPGEYWNTASSPLNPENRGYAGYVYGTLPLFSARVMGEWLDGACSEDPPLPKILLRRVVFGADGVCREGHYTGYGGIHLVGRLLSILADLMTLLALTLLAYLLFGDAVALLSAALYAFAVLPIQHA